MVEEFPIENRLLDDVRDWYLGSVGLLQGSSLSTPEVLGYVLVREHAPRCYFFSDKLSCGLVVGRIGELEDFQGKLSALAVDCKVYLGCSAHAKRLNDAVGVEGG